VRLITQPARHDWMLAATFTDAAALAEIGDIQQLLLDAPEPDLTALALIAVERYRLSLRNDDLPRQLPVLWFRLGYPHRAEQLARSITSPDEQAAALTEVAMAMVAAGQPDRAEQLARTLTNPYRQAGVLTEVATALVAAGQPDRAEQLAYSIPDPYRMAALTKLAVVLAENGSVAARTRCLGVTATLLASSSWFRATPVLVALAPTAVTAVGVAILEVLDHSPGGPLQGLSEEV